MFTHYFFTYIIKHFWLYVIEVSKVLEDVMELLGWDELGEKPTTRFIA